MAKLITAYTKLDAIYPGYLNFSRDDDGSVIVTARGDPTVRPDGALVCGHAADRGKPGRCTPGDENCNNYCNMAPQNGPMAASPKSCTQTFCGETVAVRLSSQEWDDLVHDILGAARQVPPHASGP